VKRSGTLCFAVLIAAMFTSSAQAAGFRCSASAARVTVLGQVVEPVTANTTGPSCAGASKTLTGAAAGFTGPLSLGALIASTEVFPAQKSVVATGGVADLKVSALPSLPVTLPVPAVPDAARTAIANALQTSVDLGPVKALIPVLPTNLVTNLVTTLPVNLPTNLPTTLPTNLPTNLVLDLLDPLLDDPLEVIAANAANDATNTANAATNAANLALNAANAAANASNLTQNITNAALNAANDATNTANAALNSVRNAIPASVAVDGTATLNAALAALLPNGNLPTLDLLRVQGAIAYAAGSCKNGSASVAGSSSVTGIKVFGQDLPVGSVIDRVLTLIDTVSIDPSQLALPGINLGLTQAQRDLIATIPAAQSLLDGVVPAALSTLQGALDALGNVKVLDPTVAQVKVTPGTRVQDARSVTQQALTVTVSIAGQQILDAVIGEAKASSAGVDCDDPLTDPSAGAGGSGGGGAFSENSNGAPATPEEAALQCTTRKLVLVDVLERGDRVKLTGVADTSLAGKTVAIVFNATGKTVAHAKVAQDGSFDTTAALPPERLRDTNDARYMATLGQEESINLKLRRRMLLTSMTSDNGKVTITGRVIPPLGKPLQPITLKRRVSCTREQVVTRFKPDADGGFRVTVKAPKGLGTAVYRMTTKVRVTAQGSGMFDTYTLPRAVDLDR
jgi:hypothetical protein